MNRLLEILVHQTLLFSAAALLLALLRPLLLRLLGAGPTYLAWLLVPLLMASPLLPGPATPLLAPTAAPVQLAALVDQALPVAQTAQAAPVPAALAWLLAWAAGSLLLAAGLVLLQRRYLARLQRDADGRWLAPSGASPAVVGLWPQRLVLPRDFEQRFDEAARRLVLAHEAVHARRHDNAWNLLGAALLCLQWFNPLAWWAWGRLRDDQELACDAAVLAAESGPTPLAAYAQAMLAAHPGGLQPALASGWATRHPLVERVRMLARHRAVSRWQRLGAWMAVLGLSGGAALLARAAEQPQPALALKAPLEKGIVFELASQVGKGDWTHAKTVLPGFEPNVMGGPRAVTVNMMAPSLCLALSLYEFADGSLRPTVQPMDETCQHPMGDWRLMRVDGSVFQFTVVTPQGPSQAQLSARFVDPKDPALSALTKANLDPTLRLSPAQRQLLDRQLAEVEEQHRQQKAQDSAWRAAREAAQPGTR